jgi:hypothetical protein
MPLPWHVVHVKEPMPSQLTHFDTSDSPFPITTVTVPAPVQNLHTSGKINEEIRTEVVRFPKNLFGGNTFKFHLMSQGRFICQFDLQGK